MNNKVSNLLKNFSYTLVSNFLSLLISILVVLIIPKLIGIEEYGYWQLYLFYSSFVGFMHFGWNDGIYLRYGGKEYKDLDRNLLFSQFLMLVFLQIIIAILITISGYLLFFDENRIFIIQMTSICLVIINARLMLLYILQCTYRIKEYAIVTIMSRILYFCLITFFLIFGIRNYKFMIIADIISNFFSFILAVHYCRDIVYSKIKCFFFSIKETVNNIKVGIKLMFANISSLLIIGSVRFGIERSWNVSTFGKISLIISLSTFLMVFINALGTILFPALRRSNQIKLPKLYLIMRIFLMPIFLGVLILYYPLKLTLLNWLPHYRESLMYLSILFPILIFEGKMTILINTYLKTIRQENLILKINIISLIISILTTIFTTHILKNLDLTVLSIVIILVIRSTLGEVFLSKQLKISLGKNITIEILLTGLFIILSWFIDSWLSVFIYTLFYLGYLFQKKQDLSFAIKEIKEITKI